MVKPPCNFFRPSKKISVRLNVQSVQKSKEKSIKSEKGLTIELCVNRMNPNNFRPLNFRKKDNEKGINKLSYNCNLQGDWYANLNTKIGIQWLFFLSHSSPKELKLERFFFL